MGEFPEPSIANYEGAEGHVDMLHDDATGAPVQVHGGPRLDAPDVEGDIVDDDGGSTAPAPDEPHAVDKHVIGNGWYELPDVGKVHGRDAAIEAYEANAAKQ